MKKGLLSIGLVLVVGVAVVWWKQPSSEIDLKTPTVNAQMHGADDAAPARPEDQVVVPKLSSAAEMGKLVFDDNCSACHGENAAGTENGPPFIHTLYRPAHHSDFAFQRAAQGGVQAHHWKFGNMAPVDGVTEKQIEWVVQYVRELQRANGVN